MKVIFDREIIANGVTPPDYDGGEFEYFHHRTGWRKGLIPPLWVGGQRYRYHAKSTPAPTSSLSEDDETRNSYPMFDGLLAYFPNALAEVARVSKIGNDQHNPGEPLGWARSKSTDHENKIARHLVDAGKKDARGVRHSARLAWRALALLQQELEREEGYPRSRGSRD